MIRTLSPYYITIPWIAPNSGLTATKVLVKVYVWDGLKTDIPSEATYEVTKENATSSTDSFDLNIANWINDFIDITQQDTTTTELIDGNNQQWIKFETYYTTTDENDLLLPSNETTKLFSRGYSYGMEGKNAEASQGFLVPITEYKVGVNSVISIPYLIDETTVVVPTLTINSITFSSGITWTLDYTTSGVTQSVFIAYASTGTGNYVGLFPQAGVSPYDFDLNVSAGDYDIRLSSYDPNNNTVVYSNVITITVV